MVISKLIRYKSYKLFGFPKTFPMNLTLGLTYRCNSRCSTCNIWKRKEFKHELSLNEFEKIFKNIGKNRIYLLILTGGEPFLHKDIVEICEYAEKYCKPETVVIPTNCILNEIVVRKTEEILKNCRKSHITVNISLDGIYGKHDFIRGTPGNFDKAMNVYKKLKSFEKKYKNFDVSLHTVISKFNFMDFKEIFEYVSKELKPENYITEIAEHRNELNNTKENIAPEFNEYSQAIDLLIKDLETKKLNLKQALRIEYYRLVKKILKQKKQVIPCYAGIASAQIDPTGEVWFCCVRAESIGNIRDVNYDLMRLWFNEKAEKQRKSIKNKECCCPLASASYTNISLSFAASSRTLYKLLKSRIK